MIKNKIYYILLYLVTLLSVFACSKKEEFDYSLLIKNDWYHYIDPLQLDEFGYLQGMILKHDSRNGFKIANTSTRIFFEKYSDLEKCDTRYDNIGQILHLSKDSLLIKMKTPLKIMRYKGKYLPIAVDTLLFLSNPYNVDSTPIPEDEYGPLFEKISISLHGSLNAKRIEITSDGLINVKSHFWNRSKPYFVGQLNNTQLNELRKRLFIALIIVDVDRVYQQPHDYIKVDECYEELIALNITFNIDLSDMENDFYSSQIIGKLRHQEVSLYYTKVLAYDHSIKQLMDYIEELTSILKFEKSDSIYHFKIDSLKL